MFILSTYFSCACIEFVVLYKDEKVVVSGYRVDFSLNLGGESEWTDVGCLTACITANRSGDLVRLTLIVCLGYRRQEAICCGRNELCYRIHSYVLL